MIKSILDRRDDLIRFKKEKITRGELTGFRSLDALYTIKQGTFTIVYAEPQHGKSELIFELAHNQVDRYGKRCLICSPEMGGANDIIAEIFLKHTGFSMIESDWNYINDEKKFEDAICYLSEYFIVVDPDERDRPFSVKELFELSYEWEKKNKGKKIDIIVGEPYNELYHDMKDYGSRQDLYIEDLFGYMRRECKKTGKHFFLSMHPAQSSPIQDHKTKIIYYPKPMPRGAAGGQASYRKAFSWLTLWRPADGLLNDSGYAYDKNEVHVYVDKAKPKGVSFRGKCTLYLDWKRSRYYEDYGTGKRYAFEHEKPEFAQSEMFTPVEKDAPF